MPSDTLSSQIPTSRAANAFNVFQRRLHQLEIVRLCALWDRAGDERESIPSIIELIDHPDVIEALAQETLAGWIGVGGHMITNPSDDADLRALGEEALLRSNESYGQEQAQKARDDLRKAITDVRAILCSQRLAGIMNLRHKQLAHSLSETSLDKKGPVAPMKYGDEREVLSDTLLIVEALYCWVSGKGFSFEDSRKIARKNAEALWKQCTFHIQPIGSRTRTGGKD
jgi:hypothetical protein